MRRYLILIVFMGAVTGGLVGQVPERSGLIPPCIWTTTPLEDLNDRMCEYGLAYEHNYAWPGFIHDSINYYFYKEQYERAWDSLLAWDNRLSPSIANQAIEYYLVQVDIGIAYYYKGRFEQSLLFFDKVQKAQFPDPILGRIKTISFTQKMKSLFECESFFQSALCNNSIQLFGITATEDHSKYQKNIDFSPIERMLESMKSEQTHCPNPHYVEYSNTLEVSILAMKAYYLGRQELSDLDTFLKKYRTVFRKAKIQKTRVGMALVVFDLLIKLNMLDLALDLNLDLEDYFDKISPESWTYYCGPILHYVTLFHSSRAELYIKLGKEQEALTAAKKFSILASKNNLPYVIRLNSNNLIASIYDSLGKENPVFRDSALSTAENITSILGRAYSQSKSYNRLSLGNYCNPFIEKSIQIYQKSLGCSPSEKRRTEISEKILRSMEIAVGMGIVKDVMQNPTYSQESSNIPQIIRSLTFDELSEEKNSVSIQKIIAEMPDFEHAILAKMKKDLKYEFPTPQSSNQLTVSRHKELLGQGEALILLFEGQVGIYSMFISEDTVLHRSTRESLKSLSQVFPIDSLVPTYSGKPSGLFNSQALKNGLFKVLWPMEKSMPNLPQKVYVIPAGEINRIPFDALTYPSEDTSAPPDYLLYHHEIVLYPTLQKWYETKTSDQTPTAGQNLVAICPGYEAPDSGYGFLGHKSPFKAYSEQASTPGMLDITQSFKKNYNFTRFSSTEATKPTLFEQMENVGLLYLAAHGEGKVDDVLQSSVQLYPDTSWSSEDEGKLISYEVYQHSMNADLVVLGGCQTGIGNHTYSDGLHSLSRAFMVAGSRAVLMSLWEADEPTTVDIHKRFMKKLFEGKSKSQALREAKLEFLAEAPNEYLKHPYYWASHQLVGDESPLHEDLIKASKGNHVWTWLLLSILCGGLAALLYQIRLRENS